MTQDVLGFEEKINFGTRPTYTYDEIVEKLMRTHVGGMDAESCKVLMTRGIEEHPEGSRKYRFTHDIRVHYMPVQGLSGRQVAYVMENFRYGFYMANWSTIGTRIYAYAVIVLWRVTIRQLYFVTVGLQERYLKNFSYRWCKIYSAIY